MLRARDQERPMTNATSNPAPAAARKTSLKAKAAEEFRSFLVLFFYLWALFGVFVLNQSIVQREEGINFTMQGFAFINALVFAKVMMVFEMFDPGKWLRKRPLIYPILYETVLLTVLFIVVHILEKMIEGAIHGKPTLENVPSFGGGGLAGLLSASVLIFVALVPYFGIRNLNMTMGQGRLRALLFGASAGRSEAAG
jgi:hypothetical protein